MQNLNPEQALNVLDNVSSQVQASREDHATIQTAVQVLRAVVTQWNADNAPKASDPQPDTASGEPNNGDQPANPAGDNGADTPPAA